MKREQEPEAAAGHATLKVKKRGAIGEYTPNLSSLSSSYTSKYQPLTPDTHTQVMVSPSGDRSSHPS